MPLQFDECDVVKISSIFFNNAILPLSAVSDHWLHFKIRRTAAATGHSGLHEKEMLKPAQ
jgi:hypothetical protein